MFLAWIKKNKFWVLISAVFLLLRLPSLFEPNWYGDEGIYLVLGQALRKGLTLYTQIHDNKPPTLYYLAALGQTVFGFRLLLLIWMIPTIYIFYLLSKKFFTGYLLRITVLLFLILTSIPLFEGNIANAEIFMLLPTILGIYLIYTSKYVSNYLLIITGLLLGFAFTIKIPVAVEFAFLCFWLLITNFDIKKIKYLVTSYFIFVLSFFTPFLFYLIYFFFKGALSQFLFASILQNFGYLSSWTTGSHSGSATSGGIVIRMVYLIIFYVFTFFLLHKKLISKNIAFLTLWFSSTIFGVLLSTRPYPHYLIQALPPLVLIISYLFDPVITKKVRLYLFFCFLFLVSCFFKYKFYVYPVFSYYSNFYLHANTESFFSQDITSDAQLSQYIKQNTSPSDKIFVWGDHPFVYVASDRLPVGKFTVAYHIADFQQYDSILDQLKIYFPKYIVYYPQPGRNYPALDRLITRYYRPVETFGRATIYQHP